MTSTAYWIGKGVATVIRKIFCVMFVFVISVTSSDERPTLSRKPLVLSTVHLQNLVSIDKEVYMILRKSISLPLQNNLKAMISRMLNDYETSLNFSNDESETNQKLAIVANPNLVIRMLMRLSIDLEMLMMKLQESREFESVQLLRRLELTIRLEDLIENWDILEESIQRLLQIMLTYDLGIWQVIVGQFQNLSTGFGLTEYDCGTIAEVASISGYHALAVEWADAALRLTPKSVPQKEAEISKRNLLKTVIQRHDHEFEADRSMTFRFFMKKIKGQDYLQIPRQRTFYGKTFYENSRLLKFYKLCSGETLQPQIKTSFYCWYDTTIFPAFSPLKVELLSMSPLILQFYDIVSKQDSVSLITEAEPRLDYSQAEYSSVNGQRTKLRQRHPLRNSFDVIFRNTTETPAIRRLSSKIEAITKYRLGWGGVEMQFTSYTYGGSFGVHHDAANVATANSDPMVYSLGNRIATFLVYLTDVKGGGLTAFPELQLAIKPVPGSGVFWFNLDTRENLDDRMYHGACPLILGNTKWVVNMVSDRPANSLQPTSKMIKNSRFRYYVLFSLFDLQNNFLYGNAPRI